MYLNLGDSQINHQRGGPETADVPEPRAGDHVMLSSSAALMPSTTTSVIYDCPAGAAALKKDAPKQGPRPSGPGRPLGMLALVNDDWEWLICWLRLVDLLVDNWMELWSSKSPWILLIRVSYGEPMSTHAIWGDFATVLPTHSHQWFVCCRVVAVPHPMSHGETTVFGEDFQQKWLLLVVRLFVGLPNGIFIVKSGVDLVQPTHHRHVHWVCIQNQWLLHETLTFS